MPKNFPPAIDCTTQARHPIALAAVTSNQLKAVGYDADTQTLAIRFTRGPGCIYHYEGVTPDQHRALVTAESLGKHFGEHIQILPSKKYAPDPVVAEPDEAESTEDAAPTGEELEAAGQTRLVS